MSGTCQPGHDELMIRRFAVLGFVAALLVAGDYTARGFVESKVNERAKQEAPAGATVSASIGSFPFVPRLLLSTEVSHVGVHLENLAARVITFAQVDIDLHGVQLDRSRLFGDRKVRIVAIDKGTIEATLTQEALSDALHVPVTIASGVVNVKVLGASIPVTPGVNSNGALTLKGPGLSRSFTLAIPKTDYIPCLGDITVLAGRIRFGCEINDVPPALLDAVQSVSD